MEFLNHFFGTCGEYHLNIFSGIALTGIFFFLIRKNFQKRTI